MLNDVTPTFSQLVYEGFPTAKASTIPGGEIESGRGVFSAEAG